MKARIIAYYLPQYYPVPENDKNWGKGFTEWTNVTKAKPLFRGHEQPQLPADLGFYDLRLKEVRREQAKLAEEYGIEGFCYWHYWFGNGEKVLDMPFNEVFKDNEITFPFCFAWANHSWTTKTWEKRSSFEQDKIIFEQKYLGIEDYTKHFYDVLPAFKDKRYILVENKPLFVIFDPFAIPDLDKFISIWNKLAKENGLNGVYFVARCESLGNISIDLLNKKEKIIDERYAKLFEKGVNGINSINLKYAEFKSKGIFGKLYSSFLRKFFPLLSVEKYRYKDIIKNSFLKQDYRDNIYPQLIPRRDRSPRAGRKAIVYYQSTPEYFDLAIKKCIECVKNRDYDHRLIFLNAWNEWGEGAYIEPDLKYGRKYLETLKENIEGDNN